MPISNFDGETFVAFIDISGFKQLMNDKKRAWDALDKFYEYGYKELKEMGRRDNASVEGFFISDCGILFVRNCDNSIKCLKVLLKVIKELNRKMLNYDFMLTTTVAYGEFKCQERFEYSGIEKNPIYGKAYVCALMDNESGKPKIQPGQCRIVKQGLPDKLISSIDNISNDEILRMVKRRDNDKDHYYFYWMVETPNEIKQFEEEYTDAYNLKYAGMLKALKRNRDGRHFR